MVQKYAYVKVGGADGIELKNKVVEMEVWNEQIKLGTLIKIGRAHV